MKSVTSENGRKDLNGETVKSGTMLQYRITVKNTATEERTFTVTDEVPEGVEFVSAADGGECKDGTVTWTVALSGGDCATVSFLARVKEEAAGSSVQNTARMSADGLTLTSNRVRTYVEKPDTLLDDIKDLIDKAGGKDSNVTVNIDNSNKNETAGSSAEASASSKADPAGNGSGSSAQGSGSGNSGTGNGQNGSSGSGSGKSDGKNQGGFSLRTDAPKTGDNADTGCGRPLPELRRLPGASWRPFLSAG